MRTLAFLTLVAILFGTSYWFALMRSKPANINLKNLRLFQEWAKEYNKSYSTPEEFNYRLTVFAGSVDRIEAHNKANHSYQKGLNQFSDWEDIEFNKLYSVSQETERALGAIPKKYADTKMLAGLPNVPESVDWRGTAAVTPVRDMKACASCYAITAAEAVEAALFLAYGTTPQLSVQNILDCSSTNPYLNKGCDGGSLVESAKFIKDKGLATESNYRFVHQTGPCQDTKEKYVKAGDVEFYFIAQGRSDLIKNIVAYKPITAKINNDNMKDYKHGIIMGDTCSTIPNHFASIVGYGKEVDVRSGKTVLYWIMKNNIGDKWGENGYFRLLRSEGEVPGVCLLTDNACFAAIK